MYQNISVITVCFAAFTIAAITFSPYVWKEGSSGLQPEGPLEPTPELSSPLRAGLLGPSAFSAGVLAVAASLVCLRGGKACHGDVDPSLEQARDTDWRLMRAVLTGLAIDFMAYLICALDGTLAYVSPDGDVWLPLQLATTYCSHLLMLLILKERVKLSTSVFWLLFACIGVIYSVMFIVNAHHKTVELRVGCGVTAMVAILIYYSLLPGTTACFRGRKSSSVTPNSNDMTLSVPLFARMAASGTAIIVIPIILMLACGFLRGKLMIVGLIAIDSARLIAFVTALAVASYDTEQIHQLQRQLIENAQAKVVQMHRQQMLKYMCQHLRLPAEGILAKMEDYSQVLTNIPAVTPAYDGIKSQVRSICAVLDDLSDLDAWLSGKMALSLAWYRALDITATAVSNCRVIISQKHINVVVDIDHDLPSCIEVDGDRISQVLTNLVHNACKFSAAMSSVKIQVYCTRSRDITVSKATSDGVSGSVVFKAESEEDGKSSKSQTASTATATCSTVRFEVIDQGPGIMLDTHDKIFKPFEKLDERGDRVSGLSLAISKQIVELHGGRIGFTSHPGHGATFFFEVPGRQGTSPCPVVDSPPEHLKIKVDDPGSPTRTRAGSF